MQSRFTPDGLQRISYEETGHYRITRAFLRDPQAMMRELLKRDGELDLGD